jgi:hypothetical protein
MFGSRGDYLKYFELVIPKSLYLDWQKCFIFHRLSLESRKQSKTSPIWLDGERITAVSSSSIDKTNVVVDRGEMSFSIFEFNSNQINEVLAEKMSSIMKIKALSELLGQDHLPLYLVSYIESFLPLGDKSIAVHTPKSIAGYKDKVGDTNKATITRSRGFIGNRELELAKFPNAIHHISILYNDQNKARVFYKYEGNIRFLKISKK